MSEDKKKEYLKKNFIIPLSQSFPANDYFMNSNIGENLSNENFANYIKFDLKNIAEDFLIKSINNNNNDIQIENQPYEDIKSEPFQLLDPIFKENLNNIIFSSHKKTKGNPHLKIDEIIELNNFNENLFKIQRISTKTSLQILDKFYRHILVVDSINNYKINLNKFFLDNWQKEDYFFTKYQDLCNNDSKMQNHFEDFNIENFNKINSQNSLKNIFETDNVLFYSQDKKEIEAKDSNIFSFSNSKVILNDENTRIEKSNTKTQLSVERNINTPVKNNLPVSIKPITTESLLYSCHPGGESLFDELKNIILGSINSKNNLEEFKIDELAQEVKKSFCDLKHISNRNISAVAFYNLLIICQTKNIYLKQKEPFSSLFINKIC